MLEAIVSWPTFFAALLVFGFAPGALLRLIVLAFHCDDPRRSELLAQLHTVPRPERPFWVLEQLEVALFEGICGRLGDRRRRAPDAAPSRLRRVLAWMSVPLTPVAALAAITGASMAGRHLIPVHDLNTAIHKLVAVSFLLTLILFALARLGERQARRLEDLLALWLRRWDREFVTALPEHRRSFRASAEDSIPVGRLQVRSLLEQARERPAIWLRLLATATAALVEVSAIGRVGWEAYLGQDEPAAVMSVIAFVSVALFGIAWCDLRRGRSRRLSRPLTATPWLRWQPSAGTTIIPTALVMFVALAPVVIHEFVWTTQSAWSVRAASFFSVLLVWGIAWRYRTVANGAAIARWERALAPLSSALTHLVLPVWSTLRGFYVLTGIVALVLFGVAASAPPENEVAVEALWVILAAVLPMHIMCGLVLSLWARPAVVRSVPANCLLNDHVGPVAERRIETAMTVILLSGCVGTLASLAVLLLA